MQKLSPTRRSAPLFKAASSRLIEAQASNQGLMERAGMAVAKLALAVSGEGTIWVVCDAGNNGGDGLVAARVLHLNGRRVRISLMAGSQPIDAQAALRAVAADAALRTRLSARAALGGATVLTPHPLEAARLLQCSSAEIQSEFWHGMAGETQTNGPVRAADLVERMHALHGSAL